jgi:hypothetical protein
MTIALNGRLPEFAQIIAGFVPVDMSSAANNGDWVSLKNYDHCSIVLFKAIGTAGDDPTITVKQAQDVSGTGAKALTFTTLYSKQGTQTSIGTWTLVTQSAANTYSNDTSAENQAIWVIDIRCDELDTDNGFDCIQASVADVGTNAQLGCMLYFLYGARYGGSMPSAIID